MITTDQLNTTPMSRRADDLGASTGDGDVSGLFETVIRPSRGWVPVDWRELIRSHELFYTLILRDIKVRYKQTVLGVAWAVIQPVFTMVVFTVIFGEMVKVDTGKVPYPIFVLAGLVPWTFFSNAIAGAGLSLINQQHLMTKIYFPRMFVPAATAGAFLVDLAIGLGILLVLMPIYGYYPGWGILALPLVVLLTFAATLGISLILAAMTILYRDLRYVIPFCLQLLMYLSPVIYRPDTLLQKLPPSLRWVPALNPMFGIINAYRASLLGTPWEPGMLAVSTASALAMLAFGTSFFRKTERHFADIA